MQSVALGAAFAQTLIKVVWWKKSRQLGARRWKDVSFVTVNLCTVCLGLLQRQAVENS